MWPFWSWHTTMVPGTAVGIYSMIKTSIFPIWIDLIFGFVCCSCLRQRSIDILFVVWASSWLPFQETGSSACERKESTNLQNVDVLAWALVGVQLFRLEMVCLQNIKICQSDTSFPHNTGWMSSWCSVSHSPGRWSILFTRNLKSVQCLLSLPM